MPGEHAQENGGQGALFRGWLAPSMVSGGAERATTYLPTYLPLAADKQGAGGHIERGATKHRVPMRPGLKGHVHTHMGHAAAMRMSF